MADNQGMVSNANLTLDCVLTSTPTPIQCSPTIGSVLIPGYLLVRSETDSQTYRLQQTFMQIDVESDQQSVDLSAISLAIDQTSVTTDSQNNCLVVGCVDESPKFVHKKSNSKTNRSCNKNKENRVLSEKESKNDKNIELKNTRSGKPLPPSRLARIECDVCGKQFKKSYINEHKKIHNNDKPYKCMVCGKTYRSVIQ